jgi:GH35 family endo-1,4-beta-xylanase
MNELAKDIAKNLLKEDSYIDGRIERGIEENRKGRGSVEVLDGRGNPISGASVKLKLKKHECHFGCNSFFFGQFEEEEKNQAHNEAFKDLFNLAVLPFYWSDLEPIQGQLRFDKDSPNIYRRPAVDLVLDFCEANNITPKGHPLCWHNFLPEWLSLDKPSMTTSLEKRIKEIADRYGNRIKIWDVCNEAIMLDPADINRRMPENHVEFAFKCAQKYLPQNTQLIYNDYYVWDNRGVYTPMYMLSRHLKNLDVNLGGLGLQFHMFGRAIEEMRSYADVQLNPYNLYSMMDLYGKLGLPINLSEITITAHADLGDGPAFQKEVAEKLYKIWFSHAAVDGVTWWNLVDDTAYVNPKNPSWNENAYKGGLLNYDLTPKPAYEALRKLVKEDWITNCKLDYKSEIDNNFVGFYGEYDVEIETNAGTYTKELKLSKGSINNFKFEVEE